MKLPGPGRELDVLVAKMVMSTHHEGVRIWGSADHYSTDIACAWTVIEQLEGMGSLCLLNKSGNGWRATIDSTRDGTWAVEAPTASHAICIAALRLVGYQPAWTAAID